jgi:hypothetical protein
MKKNRSRPVEVNPKQDARCKREIMPNMIERRKEFSIDSTSSTSTDQGIQATISLFDVAKEFCPQVMEDLAILLLPDETMPCPNPANSIAPMPWHRRLAPSLPLNTIKREENSETQLHIHERPRSPPLPARTCQTLSTQQECGDALPSLEIQTQINIWRDCPSPMGSPICTSRQFSSFCLNTSDSSTCQVRRKKTTPHSSPMLVSKYLLEDLNIELSEGISIYDVMGEDRKGWSIDSSIRRTLSHSSGKIHPQSMLCICFSA